MCIQSLRFYVNKWLLKTMRAVEIIENSYGNSPENPES